MSRKERKEKREWVDVSERLLLHACTLRNLFSRHGGHAESAQSTQQKPPQRIPIGRFNHKLAASRTYEYPRDQTQTHNPKSFLSVYLSVLFTHSYQEATQDVIIDHIKEVLHLSRMRERERERGRESKEFSNRILKRRKDRIPRNKRISFGIWHL